MSSPPAIDTNHYWGHFHAMHKGGKKMLTDPNPTCKQKRDGGGALLLSPPPTASPPPPLPADPRSHRWGSELRPYSTAPGGPPHPPGYPSGRRGRISAEPGGRRGGVGAGGAPPEGCLHPHLGGSPSALPNAARSPSGGGEDPGRGAFGDVIIDLRTWGGGGGTDGYVDGCTGPIAQPSAPPPPSSTTPTTRSDTMGTWDGDGNGDGMRGGGQPRSCGCCIKANGGGI